MAECPRCKEDMPLLSKICPVCGYVADSDETNLNADEFANVLEECLLNIKNIPEPTFLKSMGQLTFIIYPIIAVYMLMTAVISEAGLFWILFVIFLALSITALIRKAKGRLGNDRFNREFKELKNEYEYNERIAKRNFGKNREVSTLLAEISSQISAIEHHRKAASSKNLMIWAVILVLFFALGGTGIFSVNKSLNESSWQEAIEEFESSSLSPDDDQIEGHRQEVIKTVLAAGEGKAAEDFFITHSMGNKGDLNDANLIVTYYVKQSEPEAAKQFVDRCTGMRYKSDVQKLEKLLNR